MPEDPTRYFHELEHKFYDGWRVAIYCISFVFLSLHLLHGFASSFQSVGLKNKDKKTIIEKLIDTFLYAGKVSLELREKGLEKKISSLKLKNPTFYLGSRYSKKEILKIFQHFHNEARLCVRM